MFFGVEVRRRSSLEHSISQLLPHIHEMLTHVFSNIVENVRLQWQVHIDRTSNPTQISLSHIQHSVHLSCLFSGNLLIVNNLTEQRPSH